ncbi:30S ribosomal protein S5 [Candidatus Woesebacteria bacterium]|nr:30S ribosomal protein S5 [Candidatus Woesebacteria bacterium]
MTGYIPKEEKEFEETVIEIKRVSKKTKGGNTIRFTALVVVGDKKGRVGVGLSKSPDVRGAITKAFDHAKRRLITVPLKGDTIPYGAEEKFSAAKVILKPAPSGSGVVAGGPMRAVLEAAGVRNAVGKILGTTNKASNVYATINALKKIGKIDRKLNARKDIFAAKKDKKNDDRKSTKIKKASKK